MRRSIEQLNIPTSVEDLKLVEVLKVEFNIEASDINGEIILPEGAEMPSDEEIASAKEALLSKYNSIEYTKKRRVSYPSIAKQLDALYHDIINGNLTADNSTFVAMLQEVKNQYPKPE